MEVLKLKLPLTNTKSYWVSFINEYSRIDLSSFDTVEFDFSGRCFIDPGCLVLLACFIERITDSNSIEVNFTGGSNGLNNHLENIKFKRYWEIGFERDRFTTANNYSTLCLWKISRTMIETYGQQAQLYFSRSYLRDYDLQPLSTALVEVFNNIFDHADSPVSGYVLTQYFPNINKLTFAICDFGKGIPVSLNNYYESIGQSRMNIGNALHHSLTPRVSAKSRPNNAGMGLATVLDLSNYSRGNLRILSDTGSLIKSYNSQFIISDSVEHFQGTFIMVEFDTTALDLIDEEETIHDF